MLIVRNPKYSMFLIYNYKLTSNDNISIILPNGSAHVQVVPFNESHRRCKLL